LPELLDRAALGPDEISEAMRRRWALTYGDQIDALFGRIGADPDQAKEIAPGVLRAELEHAVEVEDAMTAEDFLLRRTKLHLTLDERERKAVARWFKFGA
jgi:glycerol-3-phosphate dehydrogenase